MSILFCSAAEAPEPWREALSEAFPGLEFQVYSEIARLDEVRYLLAWNPPSGLWQRMPRLRAVLWLGAGVDRLLSDPSLPPDLPIVRLVDAGFAQQMSEYALYAVLHFQRRMGEYAAMQKACVWRPLSEPIARDWPVGVLGLGAIGAAVAKRMAQMGFPVFGWSARGAPIEGVEVFSGKRGAREVLARAQVLVNILPLTAQTANFFDSGVFSRMRHGAYLVNIARGGHIVEVDLLAALDAGRLSGAMLDVFRDEPLPKSHPFWGHPKIILTPHVAAQTNVLLARSQIIENIARLERGEMPHGLVDRRRGY
ncbi:MAG: glyoxylate/hydroxypyruvate reductase A [Burkholderiales bacterium]